MHQPATPSAIRRLLRRCLQKDPKTRLHDIGDARLEIEEARADSDADVASAATVSGTTARRLRERLVWFLVGGLVVAFAALGATWYFGHAADAGAVRFLVAAPDGWRLAAGNSAAAAPLAVSPDGRLVAFVARTADAKTALWIRSLETLAPQMLPGWTGLDNKLTAVEVNGRGPAFEVGAVTPLFEILRKGNEIPAYVGWNYDVSADGQRFIVNTVSEQTAMTPMTVVGNWQAALKK